MNNNKSKRVSWPYLLFMMAIGGAGGFLLSSRSIPYPDDLTFNPGIVYDYDILFGAVAIACILLSLWGVIGIARLSSLPNGEQEGTEEGPTPRELAVGTLLKIGAFNFIAALLWAALGFAYLASKEAAVGDQEAFLLVNVLCACVFTVLATVLQSVIIRHYNKLYPDRSLDMRSRNAQRELFDKLDEAERFIVYRSAHSSMKAVDRLIVIGILFFILYSFLFEFAPLPIIVLAVISIVQKAVYFREASKLGR